MRVVSAEEVHRLLDYPSLVEALRELFRRGIDRVETVLLSQNLPEGRHNDWLLLPAWQYGRNYGAKLVSVFPGNEAKGIASVQGLYLLFDGTNGLPLACIDGAAITLRKTAANSALAATYLARADAQTLLMVGAGAMARPLIEAHSAVRPIRKVLIWNRTPERAEALAEAMSWIGPDRPASRRSGERGRRGGRDLRRHHGRRAPDPGQMAEAGPACRSRRRLSPAYARGRRRGRGRARVFVDARFTAADHAGDICQPLAKGIITDADITDTFELARGEKPGRQNDQEITLFKSGGGGHEDLGTAQHILAQIAAADAR